VIVSDLTTVNVSERETDDPCPILLWLGLGAGERVAVATGVKVQEGLKPSEFDSTECRKTSDSVSPDRGKPPEFGSTECRKTSESNSFECRKTAEQLIL
jgi:hypothetical protein